MTEQGEIPEGFGYVACQICGIPVLTKLPFVGCMFCSDCPTAGSGWAWEANSEYFKQPFTVESVDAYNTFSL